MSSTNGGLSCTSLPTLIILALSLNEKHFFGRVIQHYYLLTLSKQPYVGVLKLAFTRKSLADSLTAK